MTVPKITRQMLCHIRQEISVLGICILNVLPNNVFCMYFRRQIDLRQYRALSNDFSWKQIPFLRGLNKIGDIQALFSAQVHYPQFATLNFWCFFLLVYSDSDSIHLRSRHNAPYASLDFSIQNFAHSANSITVSTRQHFPLLEEGRRREYE